MQHESVKIGWELNKNNHKRKPLQPFCHCCGYGCCCCCFYFGVITDSHECGLGKNFIAFFCAFSDCAVCVCVLLLIGQMCLFNINGNLAEGKTKVSNFYMANEHDNSIYIQHIHILPISWARTWNTDHRRVLRRRRKSTYAFARTYIFVWKNSIKLRISNIVSDIMSN